MSTPPPPPGPPPRDTGVVVALTFAGIFAYAGINLVVGLIVVSTQATVAFGVGAAVLALLSLGGGSALLVRRRSWSTGLGLGLMIGWALVSIVSAGYCTGLNPAMYT